MITHCQVLLGFVFLILNRIWLTDVYKLDVDDDCLGDDESNVMLNRLRDLTSRSIHLQNRLARSIHESRKQVTSIGPHVVTVGIV
jgi:hypothetical protein